MTELIKEIKDLIAKMQEDLQLLEEKISKLQDKEILLILKEDFHLLKLRGNKNKEYYYYDYMGVTFVLGTSDTKDIHDLLLNETLEYIVLEKYAIKKVWYSFHATHRALDIISAKLKYNYSFK